MYHKVIRVLFISIFSKKQTSAIFILFISLLFTPSNQSYSQQNGDLRGFVTDSTNGEALVFCNVFLKAINTGASTNDRGLYLVKSIPSGKEYEVTVSYVGYKTKNLNVFVKPEGITELDVQLTPLSV